MDENALVDRITLLKEALVNYAGSPGFSRRLSQTMSRADAASVTQDRWADAVESMLYEQSADGREPLLERYLRTNRNIPAQDRLVYEDWLDRNVFGVFRVDGRRGAWLSLLNVIDEMNYEVYATAGSEAISVVERGGFVATRVVPTGDIWTISGTLRLFGAKDREAAHALAAALLKHSPWLAFRNPSKIEAARKITERHHDVFTGLFGSRIVRGSGADIIAAYRTFLDACSAGAVADDAAAAGLVTPAEQLAPDGSFPAEVAESDDVLLHHHPVKSVSFLLGYGLVADGHHAPPDAAGDPAAERLRQYLEDSTVPAYILEKLAAEHSETVDAFYRTALSLPDFRWEDDGEDLLRRYKPVDFRNNALPGITPVSESLREAYASSP